MLDGSVLLACAERAICVAFVGALLGLDNIAVGQFMLAQPAVGAVLVGYIVGEPLLGVWVALTFQLLWIGQIPVGAYVPPSAAITAIAAVGLAGPSAAPLPARAVAAASLAIPVGVLAGRLDFWIKSRNVGVLHRSENDLLDGRPLALGGAVIKGVANFFLKDFFLLLVAVFVGSIALALALTQVTPALQRGLDLAFVISPAVGIGAALKVYWKGRNLAAFGVGAAAAAVVAFLFSFLI
jgi:PTS system mannose-specific IIC component/fructoselysine and glucoselysine-specific PTS system IIC component